jgi:hypothetical protein
VAPEVGAVVGAEVAEVVVVEVECAAVVDGSAEVVGDPVVVAAVEVGPVEVGPVEVGAVVLLVEMALLFVPPQAAARTMTARSVTGRTVTGSTTAPKGPNFVLLTDLPTLGHRGGFPDGWAGAESVWIPLRVRPMWAQNVPKTPLAKVEAAGQRLFGGGAEA